MFINLVVGSRRNYRMSRKGNRERLGSNSILGLQELRGEERLGSFETKGLLL